MVSSSTPNLGPELSGAPRSSSLVAAPGLLRLLQITSSNFPVGVFAYSQGLEQTIERGWVCDGESLSKWLVGLLQYNLCRVDVPVYVRAFDAWAEGAVDEVERLCHLTFAFRESRELVEEDRHLGRSLARILVELGLVEAERFVASPTASYPCLYALATTRWGIDKGVGAQALAFGWAENQALAASRLIPLGQVATQRVLSAVLGEIPKAVEIALKLSDDELGGVTSSQALVAAWHETQYSRLFRS